MTEQDSKLSYLRLLAKALPRRLVDRALFATDKNHGPPQENGTALQISLRHLTESWQRDAQQSTTPTVPVSEVYLHLLDEAIEPYRGEIVLFGTRCLSVVFRGEHHLKRACLCAIDAQRTSRAIAARDARPAIRIAVTLATGDLWLPSIGDARQCVMAFGGSAARQAVDLQGRTQSDEIVMSPQSAAALGQSAELAKNQAGLDTLVAITAAEVVVNFDDPAELDLARIDDIDRAITELEAFVIPPLSQRLRYVPNDWRTDAEVRHVVIVLTEFRAVTHGDLNEALALAACVLTAHREYGGLILSLEAAGAGHRVLTLYGLHAPTENDAERAVMAARSVVRAVDEQAAAMKLAVQTTTVVHSGEIFFGAFGNENRYGMSVAGAPIDVAERILECTEESGQLIISDLVANLLRNNFQTRKLEEVVADGDKALVLHKVEGIGGGSARYMQRRADHREIAGRATILRDIKVRVDDAIEGRGGIIGLCGEAGTGKTFLLAPIIDLWIAGGGVGVIGHCHFSTRSLPLAPITSMLLNLAGLASSRIDKSNLPLLRTALSDLCPSMDLDALLMMLTASPEHLNKLDDLDDQWESALVAIEQIVAARISKQPILYVIEDLQFADTLTLRVASRLATISRDRKFFFVGTYRPAEGLGHIRALFDHEFTLVDLGLRELRDAVASYFSAREVDERLAILLWERTRGNPCQLIELLGYLRDRGLLVNRAGRVTASNLSEQVFAELAPPSMSQQALARLDQVGPIDRRVLHMAAIIGRVVPSDILRALDPQEWSDSLYPALVRLLDAQILIPELSSTVAYRFRDDNTRVVAYSTIPPARRRELHSSVADIIERLRAGDHDHYASTLAYHREKAGQVIMAVRWYERAARAAASATMDVETVELVGTWEKLVHELAENEKPTPKTFAELSVMRFVATARHFGAEDALDQARAIAARFRRLLNQHEKAVCDLWHGAALLASGQKQSAKARLARAYESDTAATVRCDAALRMAKCVSDDPEAAAVWITRAAALVAKPDSHWADRVDLARACQAVNESRLDDARIINAQVRDRAHRSGRIRLSAIATSNLADCDLHCGDVEDARRGFAEARTMSRSLGTRTDDAIDEFNLGTAEFYAGNVDSARLHLESAALVASEIGYKALVYEARIHLGASIALLGDLQAGETICREARELASDALLTYLEPVADQHLLHIAILGGSKENVEKLLRRCEETDLRELSPLLASRLSMLRQLARPILRS